MGVRARAPRRAVRVRVVAIDRAVAVARTRHAGHTVRERGRGRRHWRAAALVLVLGEHTARHAGQTRADDRAELAVHRFGRRARRRRARLPLLTQLQLVPALDVTSKDESRYMGSTQRIELWWPSDQYSQY